MMTVTMLMRGWGRRRVALASLYLVCLRQVAAHAADRLYASSLALLTASARFDTGALVGWPVLSARVCGVKRQCVTCVLLYDYSMWRCVW